MKINDFFPVKIIAYNVYQYHYWMLYEIVLSLAHLLATGNPSQQTDNFFFTLNQ